MTSLSYRLIILNMYPDPIANDVVNFIKVYITKYVTRFYSYIVLK